MEVYTCKVWDGRLGEWINIGVFSSCAKAQENGSLYITEICPEVSLLDWERDEGCYTDWYQSSGGTAFTRMVEKAIVDQRLA